jgi:hypothetical protein
MIPRITREFVGATWSRRLIHTLPIPPSTASLSRAEEQEGARVWLRSFGEAKTVPKNLVELTFSRSSGPGGQVRSLPVLQCGVLNYWDRMSTRWRPRFPPAVA